MKFLHLNARPSSKSPKSGDGASGEFTIDKLGSSTGHLRINDNTQTICVEFPMSKADIEKLVGKTFRIMSAEASVWTCEEVSSLLKAYECGCTKQVGRVITVLKISSDTVYVDGGHVNCYPAKGNGDGAAASQFKVGEHYEIVGHEPIPGEEQKIFGGKWVLLKPVAEKPVLKTDGLLRVYECGFTNEDGKVITIRRNPNGSGNPNHDGCSVYLEPMGHINCYQTMGIGNGTGPDKFKVGEQYRVVGHEYIPDPNGRASTENGKWALLEKVAEAPPQPPTQTPKPAPTTAVSARVNPCNFDPPPGGKFLVNTVGSSFTVYYERGKKHFNVETKDLKHFLVGQTWALYDTQRDADGKEWWYIYLEAQTVLSPNLAPGDIQKEPKYHPKDPSWTPTIRHSYCHINGCAKNRMRTDRYCEEHSIEAVAYGTSKPSVGTVYRVSEEFAATIQPKESTMNGSVYTGVVVRTRTVQSGEGVSSGVQQSEVVYTAKAPFVAKDVEQAKTILAAEAARADDELDFGDTRAPIEVKIASYGS